MTTTRKRDTAFTATLVVMALLIGMLTVPAYAAEPTADVVFTFSDSGVTASKSGTGWEIEGTSLTITVAGTYKITGTCSEGSVKVKKNVTGVTLILENLTLASGKTAPVIIGKTAEATIWVLGAVTLTDKEDATTESTNEDFEGAAIKVKSGAALTITGTGVLTADGSACKNGVKGAAEAKITVTGATLNVKAAYNGLASDGELIITGGNVNVTAGNDGIKSDPDDDDDASKGCVTITGGKITVSAGDDGIKALYDLTIGAENSANGPEITVTNSYEALEAARIYLNSGTGTFTATDDGLNAACSRTVSEIAVYINGGSWLVDSQGDGIDAGGDSNMAAGGRIYVNGGKTVVLGASNNGNSALDYDTSGEFNGGTILAIGTTGMAQALAGYGAAFTSSVTKGAAVSVKDSSGAELISATAARSANWIFFASDEVASGDSVTLYLNGSKAATATVGATSSAGGFGGMGGATSAGGFGGMGGATSGQAPGAQQGGRQNNGQNESSSGTMPNTQQPRSGQQDEATSGAMPNGQQPRSGQQDEATSGTMPNGQQPRSGQQDEATSGTMPNGQQPRSGQQDESSSGTMPGNDRQQGGRQQPTDGDSSATPTMPNGQQPNNGQQNAPAAPADGGDITNGDGELTESEVNAFVEWLQSVINYIKALFNIK